MFLNTRLPSNNENMALRSSKPPTSESNAMSAKTPKQIKAGDTQQQQRRRRALGDISNRKGGFTGRSNNNKGGGGLSAKQPTKKVIFSTATTSHKSNGNGLLSKSKPMIHIDPIVQEAKQQQQEEQHDYDLVLGRTTRWSTDHEEDEQRSPFDLVSKEELFETDNLLQEWNMRAREKMIEEQRRMEEAYEKKLKEGRDCWDAGLEHVDVDFSGDYVAEEGLEFKEDEWSEDGENDLLSFLEELNL